jgi:hypothetical protein
VESINLYIPITIKDRHGITLRELMEGALSYYYNQKVTISDGVITIYVLDKEENITFVYTKEEHEKEE